MSKIKMFWWNEQPNFGDALNPIILEKLFGVTVEWADIKNAELIGAGSCLQWVASYIKKHPHEIHIWGTGYMFDQEPPVLDPRVLHHAVRGVKSKHFGLLKDVALGDPGVLSPLLFKKPISKKFKIGIVPHLWNKDDLELVNLENDITSVLIIDVSKPALEVVEQIASCEFIYSSSLHGLIVADSFGIPNQWVEFSKKLFGGAWKFGDYYSVYDIKKPVSIEFKKSLLKDEEINKILHDFEQRISIEDIQKKLLDVFPRELIR